MKEGRVGEGGVEGFADALGCGDLTEGEMAEDLVEGVLRETIERRRVHGDLGFRRRRSG